MSGKIKIPKKIDFDELSPMGSLGDMIYGGVSGTGTVISPNTTTTKKFLRQTGTGSAGAIPAWDTLAVTDLPVITDYEFLPVEVGYDDTTAPDASTTLSSTNKEQIREFQGTTANQSLRFTLSLKPDYYGSSFQFRWRGWVSQATAPSNGETIKFGLGANCITTSGLLSTAVGTATTITVTADATYVQYDKIISGWATVTPTVMGETMVIQLTRDQTADTYAQKFGLAEIQIRYNRQLSLAF